MESTDVLIHDVLCRFDYDWEVFHQNNTVVVYIKNVAGVLYPYLPATFFITGIHENIGTTRRIRLSTFNFTLADNVDTRNSMIIIANSIAKVLEKKVIEGRSSTNNGILVFGEIEERIIVSKQKTSI